MARFLDAVPLGELSTDILLVGLTAAVDSARYWQEPDGEDVLAATPHVHGALSRVAARIASFGPPAWWSAPIDRTAQACVVFDDPASPTNPSDQVADRVLSRWRDATREEEARAQRERPADPRAAFGGTWWSTPPRDLTRTTRSVDPYGPVGLRLVEDAYGWDQALVRWVATPAEATVYEVDGPEAWALLCRRFPLEGTASRRHDWFRTTGVTDRWVVPDWARAAAHVDAVHVTTAGYLSTAGRAVAVEPGTSSVLAGWNPDETFWFTTPPPAPEVDQRWHRVDDDSWQVNRR
ncbi:hypothetical protein [Cellulomonas xylanilytica]|uniref:hypothetical protein n=1 Tax=Cellulomonas xylanilytica TaxID=233583 RepID=UPI0011BF2B5D|nr:hypothetical protein [Cellulomonas xylanilytica]